VAQRLGARRTSEERGIADHDGAQKHEERRKGQRGRERGSKEGQAGVSKDVQFTGWWVGGWRCRAPPTGFGGSTSSSTTFAHSPCGQHGCFAMTGGNPGPAVARRVRRGQRGLCACDCFVQRVQWSGDDDAMRCDAMLWATGGALYPRVAAAGKQPRAVGEAQDADTQTGQDRTGQARPGPCRLSSNCFTWCADTAITLDLGVCVVELRVTGSNLVADVVCRSDERVASRPSCLLHVDVEGGCSGCKADCSHVQSASSTCVRTPSRRVCLHSTPVHLDEWKKEKPEPDSANGYVAMQGIRCLGR
jgi:hypothetical protein